MMAIKGIIFDFDGVIADSELLANVVLAQKISELGIPTSLDDALDPYQGKRWPDVLAAIEERLGASVPSTFIEGLQSATMDRFGEELRTIDGATEFIRRYTHLPLCIASSSSKQRLALCLDVLGLAEEFWAAFSAPMTLAEESLTQIYFF